MQNILNKFDEFLQDNNYDALIIKHNDEYLNDELTIDKERVAFATNFTGSNATAIIGNTKSLNKKTSLYKDNIVLTDGRYTVQVREQLDNEKFSDISDNNIKLSTVLKDKFSDNAKIAINLETFAYKEYLQLQEDIAPITLVALKQNIVDTLMDHKDTEIAAIEVYDKKYHDKDISYEKALLSKELTNKNASFAFILSLESICHVLNIRGADRKTLPVVNSRLIFNKDNNSFIFFVSYDHFKNATEINNWITYFGENTQIKEEKEFIPFIKEYIKNTKILCEKDYLNAQIYLALKDNSCAIEDLDCVIHDRACKNSTEIEWTKKAHDKDCIAMHKFLFVINNAIQNNTIESYNEERLAKLADNLRYKQGMTMPSFDTISALGSNAAMCHYNYLEVDNLKDCKDEELYLIDSGAQYIEGTTDITRTILLKNKASSDFIKYYTLVLKAHIALATTIFPLGTKDKDLDAICRRELWKYGLDFNHGTGHGVGHRLAVHEGPQNISRYGKNITELKEGMILSIEPGIYITDKLGIRIENLYYISKDQKTNFLQFKPLTHVVFDKNLIDTSLLTKDEINFINVYHKEVYATCLTLQDNFTDQELKFIENCCKGL